jgi:3-oxoacyl-[acyl-carrier-protein] synthase II
VLEELERAKRRGAPIYAEVLGLGSSFDAYAVTKPDPNARGAARAIECALKEARVDHRDVDYINAHGTSTPLGDAAETEAIKSIFREHARSVSISSTKSEIGHLLGASGGVELIFAILALREGVIPPTINLDTPDPACDLDYTPNQARQRHLTAAISNSFGFGGHNACLAVGTLRNGRA